MSDFVHLHAHSQYSLLDGLCSPHELLSAAKDLGQTSLAITDHGTSSSHRDMQIAAKELGIKPILGIEAYISETDRFDRRSTKKRDDNTSVYNHIILLAKDQDGLKNLNKLSELAWTEGFYNKPRIDLELLDEYGNGLIVLSGCMNGMIAKAIERGEDSRAQIIARWMKNRFENDFFMEIQPHNPAELNHKLLELADEFTIAPVVTSDCHFATEDQRATEEALLILSTKPDYNKEATYEKSKEYKNIFERYNYLYPDRPISFEELDVYVQSRLDVSTHLKAQGIDRTDVYENTLEIADRVGDYDFKRGVNLLPIPKRSAHDKLREMCEKGLASRGLQDDQVYLDRLVEELDVIKKKDFSAYFLIVADTIQWARSQGIGVGPGRGSAAGSLVCFLTDITLVDPIKYNLLFARFINIERNDMPDIDVDIQDIRRGEVKEYLQKKFKHVASISTFTYFKDKGVIKDAARVFKVPLGDTEKATKQIENFEDFESSENTRWYRDKYPEVLPLARNLRGRIRGVGMHAAGLVVSKQPISDFAPIETRSDKDNEVSGRIPVVALDMNQAADIGFIKMDWLGLKTLNVIVDTLSSIKDRHGIDIDLSTIDLEDKDVYYDLSQGWTQGVFQAEATPYTNLLMKMGVDNFEGLAASNALVRPGAMNTVGAAYVARKQGREAVRYVHKIMKPFLERTYGVIIYQEQVMQACVELAGMSWAQADQIRKIIGKKKDVHEFDAYRDMFIEGATKNIALTDAEQMWHDFEAHAGYSFNLSHAVAYSMLSYWTAWLKHYYPIEFMSAALSNEKDLDKRTDYLIECKRMGIRMLLPNVNDSEINFSIQGNAIRFGLTSIKGIQDAGAKRIIASRPYSSFADLKEKAGKKGSGINSKTVEAMRIIGAATFEDNPKHGAEQDYFYEYLRIPAFDMSLVTPQILSQVDSLEDFDEKGCFVILGMVKSIKRGPTWSRIEMVDQTGSVGVFHNANTQIEAGKMYLFLIGDNRIHRYIAIEDIPEKGTDPFLRYLNAEVIPMGFDQRAVIDFNIYVTKARKKMAHVILSDMDKQLQRVIVFPKNFTLAAAKMQPGRLCIPELGKLDDGTVFVKEFL